MSGIITFGVEWETSLLVVNTTGASFFEKVPYYLGNGNENPYIQYSLEGYHPPRPRANQPDRTQEYENAKAGNRCIYSLEFIFGIFNNPVEFRTSIADFVNIIKANLCTNNPRLDITQADGVIQNCPIVAIVDNPQVPTFSDCTLTRAKPPGPGVGVRFANHCPITGKGQITIGIDFDSTYRLCAYMVRTPLMMDPSMALSKRQNFRDSAFKMTSYFLYHIMGSIPRDPIVQALCFWMVYPIINQYRSMQFKKELEYFKMLLPLKGRSNFTCLVDQLSHGQQAEFMQWYNTNYLFLGRFFPKVWGYKFSQSYPDYNIKEKYIYSADVHTSIQGLGDIAAQGDQISFTYNGVSNTGSLVQPVFYGEFIVWQGRLAPLEAILSPDNSTLIFQGLGNPAFESADVNEWCIGSTPQGSTYNVVEVRELDKFYQDGLKPTPRLHTDNLEEITENVLTNLHRITTIDHGLLEISEQDYEQYVKSYRQFDAIAQEAENAKAAREGREAEEINTAQTKIVNAMDAAISAYNGGAVEYDEINWDEVFEDEGINWDDFIE